MAWAINAQIGPHFEPGYDGHGWLWELVREEREPRRVFVQVTGTAWSVYERGGSALADQTRLAIDTEGRNVVEGLLNEAEPPLMIGCSTKGCVGLNPV